MLLKRMISTLLCVLLLLGVCAVPTTAETDLHDAFMKTAFMVSRHKAIFEQGEVSRAFVLPYMEHVCPEMRGYEIVREPYHNLVRLSYAVDVDEFETLVGCYFEMDERLRTEFREAYYRADEDLYYIPCTVIDAVREFYWSDYAGYKPLGDGLYEVYARRLSATTLSDADGLTEGVDYVRLVEHKKSFHPTLQVIFTQAVVSLHPVDETMRITVRLQDGVPQLVSAQVCDRALLTADGVVPAPDHTLPDTVVNHFLPEGVSCAEEGLSALPNGACLTGERLTQGEAYQAAAGLFAGKVAGFAVYALSAVDAAGQVLDSFEPLRMQFDAYAGGTVYRVENGKAVFIGKAGDVRVDEGGVFVVAASALPTTAAPSATAPLTTTSATTATTAEHPTTDATTGTTTTATTAVTETSDAPSQEAARDGGSAAAVIAIACVVAALVIGAAVWLLLKKKG